MANALTGDFDVVAEFAIPAVNRLLAAMHRTERFLHSITLRVDDTPPPVHGFPHFAVAGLRDVFGDAVANHDRIGIPVPISGLFGSPSGSGPASDSIVNPELLGVNIDPLVPSLLKGRAQLQLSPPTVDLVSTSATTLTVRIEMICRYFPDPGTAPAAEFVRGELSITAGIDQTTAPGANVVAININANTAQISFTPLWSSRPLTAEDRAGIDQLIRNALRTGFLPSSINLPAGISHARFKSLAGSPGAIAMMINTEGGPGNPSSVNEKFVTGSDDFGFGLGSDFVQKMMRPTIDEILATPVDPASFSFSILIHTWHVTYAITLNAVDLDLKDGKMVLTMRGRATTSSWTPNFNFAFKQDLTLAPAGDTADLVVGNLSFDTSSVAVNVATWLVNLFSGAARNGLAAVRDRALHQSGTFGIVREKLSATGNLGGFIRSLLFPSDVRVHPDPFQLAYSSAEIHPRGIILHGSLGFKPWPIPRVEYEPIPANVQSGPGHFGDDAAVQGQDYSAFKSWIPGGRIQSYEWKSQGQVGTGAIDENRFVFMTEPAAISVSAESTSIVSGHSPLCVTLRGTRLTASGPIHTENVSATICGYRRFPLGGFGSLADDLMPLVALARSGPTGLVEVSGHTAVEVDATGTGAPNAIVHFPDGSGTRQIGALMQAITESRRYDAPTAVVVAMSSSQLKSVPYTEGVTYADDDAGRWKRRFGVRDARSPVTLIVNPEGKVVWKHEGEIDRASLTETLRKHLVARAPLKPNMLAANARIGQPPPNFLFDYAQGRQLTLRKLAGRPVVIVFWRSTSEPSIAAVRDAKENLADDDTLVLAINDGEKPDAALRGGAQAGLSATVVVDPHREISRAYGVAIWPTTFVIDSDGVLRAIRYGRDNYPSSPTNQSAGNDRGGAK